MVETTFTEEQARRYARHFVLPGVGEEGQRRLLDARVLIVGTGGLGSPLILYLAAAGIGCLGIVDDDVVDLSNLQRQIAHTTAAVGRPKVDSAAEAVARLNPGVRVERHAVRLNPGNAMEIVQGYDIVADGSDNFATRFLLNDACRLAGKTLVSAAVLRFDGQISTFKAPGPCYRCLYRDEPPPDAALTAVRAGIMGVMPGVMGTLQATEVIKEILGIGESLSGTLLMVDALSSGFHKVRIRPDPTCPLCGPNATIHSLADR